MRGAAAREGVPKRFAHVLRRILCGTAPHPTPLRGAIFSRKREKGSHALVITVLLLLASPALAGGTWWRGDLADPNSLDPHKASTSVEANIL